MVRFKKFLAVLGDKVRAEHYVFPGEMPGSAFVKAVKGPFLPGIADAHGWRQHRQCRQMVD